MYVIKTYGLAHRNLKRAIRKAINGHRIAGSLKLEGIMHCRDIRMELETREYTNSSVRDFFSLTRHNLHWGKCANPNFRGGCCANCWPEPHERWIKFDSRISFMSREAFIESYVRSSIEQDRIDGMDPILSNDITTLLKLRRLIRTGHPLDFSLSKKELK